MIVRNLKDARESGRKVLAPGGQWESVRLSLADDGMGFSFHITTIFKGADFSMHYQHHLEAVYCISGRGEVETLDDNAVYPIEAGTVYLLNKHDRHQLRAFEDMVMACVFNPPLNGREVHNAAGAYELNETALIE